MNPWEEKIEEDPLKCYMVVGSATVASNIEFRKENEFDRSLSTFMYYSFSSFDEPISLIENYDFKKVEITQQEFSFWVTGKRGRAYSGAMLDMIKKYFPELLV
jgi:hypothetical protein